MTYVNGTTTLDNPPMGRCTRLKHTTTAQEYNFGKMDLFSQKPRGDPSFSLEEDGQDQL